MKTSNFLVKYWTKPNKVLLGLGGAFFIMYSWFYISTPFIFNSPDETANFIFGQQWAETGSFLMHMPENPGHLILPRSVNIRDGMYLPGGFLGLPLLIGLLSSISPYLALFLTPVLAVLAVYAFSGMIKRVFGKKTAFWTAILMLSMPQWFHFTAKGFLPNVSYLSLLIIAIYLIVKAHEEEGRFAFLLSSLSGLSLGLSLFIRPAEFIWVGLCILLLGLYFGRQIRWKRVFLSVFSFLIIMLLMLFFHKMTFGSVLSTGYSQYNNSVQNIEQKNWYDALSFIFPFGVDGYGATLNLFIYWVKLFWWQFLLFLVGLVSFYKIKSKKNVQIVYASIFGVSLIYLGLLYGSWFVQDDLDSGRISVGISYVRYWLPLYLLSIPFMYKGVEAISARSKRNKKLLEFVLLIGLIWFQLLFTFFAKDGLSEIQKTIVNYNHVQQILLEQTEENAVIITERNDKLIWPQRGVINYSGQSFDFLSRLSDVIDLYPVYWLTILPADHVDVWEETAFFDAGFVLNEGVHIEPNFTLYQVNYE